MNNSFENEFMKDGVVWSKYILVHDDSFGREKTKDEITENLDKMNVKYKAKVLSVNGSGKVNMLYLEIEGSYESWEVQPFEFSWMESGWYYETIPCNYNWAEG